MMELRLGVQSSLGIGVDLHLSTSLSDVEQAYVTEMGEVEHSNEMVTCIYSRGQTYRYL